MSIPPLIGSRIADLALDNTSGATSIAKNAAAILLQLVDPQTEVPDQELVGTISESTYALARAQPTMAPLVNLAHKVLRTLSDIREPAEVRDQIRGLAASIANQLDTSTTRIALHALQLIDEGSLIMTHSYSLSVRKTLVSAWESGKRFSVLCTESRPMFEGIQLARELSHHGIPVTVIADAASFSELSTVSGVMVGADSVSFRGVVNKVGTSGIALGAKHASIPFYVLGGSEKFIPEELVLIEKRKSPGELLAEEIPNVSVKNLYFDTTSLDHVTGMVTEEGIMPIPALRRHLAMLEQDYTLKPKDLNLESP